MLLKYFYEDKLAHASYMVGCQDTGEALVIDPGRSVDIYLNAARQEGMRISGAAETHVHADFVSGARELAERCGARLYLSNEGDANWKYSYVDDYDHMLLTEGEHFMIGNVRLEVLHTPGHTPEHVALELVDTAAANRPMGIFSGDFVFVGSVGRPDLLETAIGIPNSSLSSARQMFHSLERFKRLPDYLQVWPSHGAGSACGKDLGAVPSTTVGYEKLFNPFLASMSESSFVQMLLEGQPETPTYFSVMKQVNKHGPKVLRGLASPEHLPEAKLHEMLSYRGTVIDTRPPLSFASGHLPGTINIPVDSLLAWAGWIVDYEEPFYLICEADNVREAVRDLAYIGLDNLAGYFSPHALAGFMESGRGLQTYRVMAPKQLASKVLQGEVIVLDVRARSEWEEGHIPGAFHIMLGHLADRAQEFIRDKPIVVQCRTGIRSAIGASILQASGAPEVANMMGGILGWSSAGLPVEH